MKMNNQKYYALADYKNNYPPGTCAIETGEFRAPRKGEWYLSGAIPEAYYTASNLSTKYNILKIMTPEEQEPYNDYDESPLYDAIANALNEQDTPIEGLTNILCAVCNVIEDFLIKDKPTVAAFQGVMNKLTGCLTYLESFEQQSTSDVRIVNEPTAE